MGWCRRNSAVAALLGLVLFVFATGTATATAFAILSGLNAKEAGDNAKQAGDNAKQAQDNERVAKAEAHRNAVLLNASRTKLAHQAANDYSFRRRGSCSVR